MRTFAWLDILWQLELVGDHAQSPVARACALVGVAVRRGGFVVAIGAVPLAHHLVRRSCACKRFVHMSGLVMEHFRQRTSRERT